MEQQSKFCVTRFSFKEKSLNYLHINFPIWRLIKSYLTLSNTLIFIINAIFSSAQDVMKFWVDFFSFNMLVYFHNAIWIPADRDASASLHLYLKSSIQQCFSALVCPDLSPLHLDSNTTINATVQVVSWMTDWLRLCCKLVQLHHIAALHSGTSVMGCF